MGMKIVGRYFAQPQMTLFFTQCFGVFFVQEDGDGDCGFLFIVLQRLNLLLQLIFCEIRCTVFLTSWNNAVCIDVDRMQNDKA